MSEPYREGHEYVVCDECDSHILIELETRRLGFDPDGDVPEKWIGFTCDNDECEADCSALIANPYLEPKPEDPVTERLTCSCGKPFAVTPTGKVREHAKVLAIPNGTQAVRCEWSGRPVAELRECLRETSEAAHA
jgi:hypothetical protein